MSVDIVDDVTGLVYSNNNPIINDGPARPATEDEVMQKYPGQIALAGEVRGSYYGCKALEFCPKWIPGKCEWTSAADQFNAWAAEHAPTYIVVHVSVNTTANGAKITIIYTAALDAEEQEVLKERWPIIERELDGIRKKKREQIEAQQQVEKAQEEERTRLASVGLACERMHKTLTDELVAIRRENVRLKTKAAAYGDVES